MIKGRSVIFPDRSIVGLPAVDSETIDDSFLIAAGGTRTAATLSIPEMAGASHMTKGWDHMPGTPAPDIDMAPRKRDEGGIQWATSEDVLSPEPAKENHQIHEDDFGDLFSWATSCIFVVLQYVCCFYMVYCTGVCAFLWILNSRSMETSSGCLAISGSAYNPEFTPSCYSSNKWSQHYSPSEADPSSKPKAGLSFAAVVQISNSGMLPQAISSGSVSTASSDRLSNLVRRGTDSSLTEPITPTFGIPCASLSDPFCFRG
jgi:hypothetical protein